MLKRIINQPVPSNCYVIANEYSRSCIVVDPGTEDCKELLEYINNNNLHPDYIIFTHEHVDHIIGARKIQNIYNAKIVCSLNCATSMQSSKFNLTRMTEQWEEQLSMPAANIVLEDIDYNLGWNGMYIRFYQTEGHSKGSICFSFGNNFFSGDTLLEGYRTVTVLPGGSKKDLLVTLENILNKLDWSTTVVYPGHNNIFRLDNVVNEIKDQIQFIKNKLYLKSIKS